MLVNLVRSLAVIVLVASAASAQVVGDHIEVQSNMPPGVPVHANPGDLSFFRLPNGTSGTITAVDPATGWFHFEAADIDGWVIRRYVKVIGGSPTGGTQPATKQLVVAGFNTESPNIQDSDPTDPQTVARHIGENPDVDVWGFAEVLNQTWLNQFVAAANSARPGGHFEGVLGSTGGGDRLAIVYDSAKLSADQAVNMVSLIQPACGNKSNSRFRAPLAIPMHFGNQSFVFMVNHLQRTDNAYRHCQAKKLNLWAKQHATTPAIAVGDYNFDLDVNDPSQHDQGFDSMTQNGIWHWVEPASLSKTQCAFNSVLDFVFVSGPAQQFAAQSEILNTESSYCSNANQKKESDHRPVKARFELPQ